MARRPDYDAYSGASDHRWFIRIDEHAIERDAHDHGRYGFGRVYVHRQFGIDGISRIVKQPTRPGERRADDLLRSAVFAAMHAFDLEELGHGRL